MYLRVCASRTTDSIPSRCRRCERMSPAGPAPTMPTCVRSGTRLLTNQTHERLLRHGLRQGNFVLIFAKWSSAFDESPPRDLLHRVSSENRGFRGQCYQKEVCPKAVGQALASEGLPVPLPIFGGLKPAAGLETCPTRPSARWNAR